MRSDAAAYLEQRLDLAIEDQYRAAIEGRPFDAATILLRYPDLTRLASAGPTLVYSEYRLLLDNGLASDSGSGSGSEGRAQLRQSLLDRYPQWAVEIEEQFRFASALDSEPIPSAGKSPILGVPHKIGKYHLRRLVGSGGGGLVFEATDKVLDRTVAVKLPRISAKHPETWSTDLLREARLAAKLRHQHLLSVFDADRFGDQVYIVTAWADGGSLERLIEDDDSRWLEDDVIALMFPVARGLAQCHELQMIHGDIKPGNILFVSQSDSTPPPPPGRRRLPGCPVVSDFGMARIADLARSAGSNRSMVGTPMYMSPEQINERTVIGPQTDVYSCGLIMWELLGGRHPFADASLSRLLMSVSAGHVPPIPESHHVSLPMRRILRCCLEPDPADRYPDAAALADDLQRLHDRKAIRPPSVSWRRRLCRQVCRPEAVDVAAIIAMFVSASLAVMVTTLCLLRPAAPSVWASIGSVLSETACLAAVVPPLAAAAFITLRIDRRWHLLTTGVLILLTGCLIDGVLDGNSGDAVGSVPRPVVHFDPLNAYPLWLGLAVTALACHMLALPAWWAEFRPDGPSVAVEGLEPPTRGL